MWDLDQGNNYIYSIKSSVLGMWHVFLSRGFVGIGAFETETVLKEIVYNCISV